MVLNHSFENYSKLPDINLASPIDSFSINWKSPIGHTGTSDYYHTLAPSNYPLWWSGSWIPHNSLGVQDTCDGNAYTGIIVYSKQPGADQSYREYLVGELIDTLVAGQCYKIAFKYSMADRLSHNAISNFGILFTDSIPRHINTTNTYEVLNYTPQIEVNQVMKNDTEWVKIERFFIAKGGEKFISLGNFNDNENTDTFFIQPSQLSFGIRYSYYYLDDIVVEKSDLSNLNNLIFSLDSIFCKNEPLDYTDALPDSTIYVWNNINNDSILQIDTSGLYWLDAYKGCSHVTDSI